MLARRLAQTGLVAREADGRACSPPRAGTAPGQPRRRPLALGRLRRRCRARRGRRAQRLASRNRLVELERRGRVPATMSRHAARRRRGQADSAAAAEAERAARGARHGARRTRRGPATSCRGRTRSCPPRSQEGRARRGAVRACRPPRRGRGRAPGGRERRSRAATARQTIAADLAAARAAGRASDRAAAVEARAAAEGIAREAEIRSHRLAAIATERQGVAPSAPRAPSADRRRCRTAPRVPRRSRQALADEPDTHRIAAPGAVERDRRCRGARARPRPMPLPAAKPRLAEAGRAARAASTRSPRRATSAAVPRSAVAAAKQAAELTRQIEDALRVRAGRAGRSRAAQGRARRFPTSAEIEARLDRYREERERLGGVNLRAEEEATELAASARRPGRASATT